MIYVIFPITIFLLFSCWGKSYTREAFPVYLCMAAEFFVWVVAYLPLALIFDSGYGNEIELRFLILGVFMLGGMAPLLFLRGDLTFISLKIHVIDEDKIGNYLWGIGIIVFIYLSALTLAGGLRARETVGNYLEPGSALYFIRSFEAVPILLYTLLGISWDKNIAKGAKLFGILIALLVLILTIASGGRGGAVYCMIAFALAYMLSSGGSVIKSAAISGIVLSFALVLLCYIGVVRDSWEFGRQSSILGRVEVIFTAEGFDEASASSAVSGVLLRIAEPFGQDVIDQTVATGKFYHFENYERLFFMYVPAIIADNQKQTLDDGPEALKNHYGYTSINKFQSLPITLLADCYRRFGVLGCFVFPFILSVMLIFISKYLNPKKGTTIFFICLYVQLLLISIRLYPFSFFGALGMLMYHFLRTGVVCYISMYVSDFAFRKKIK